jgi:hypothetical protein
VLITVGVPLSLQMGFNPFITAWRGRRSQFCLLHPPAFVPIVTATPIRSARKHAFRGSRLAGRHLPFCALIYRLA